MGPGILKTQVTQACVTYRGANIQLEDITNWFSHMKCHMPENNWIHMLNDPTRNFTADETGVVLSAVPIKVLVRKGVKRVTVTAPGNDKEQITVLGIVCADCRMLPPISTTGKS